MAGKRPNKLLLPPTPAPPPQQQQQQQEYRQQQNQDSTHTEWRSGGGGEGGAEKTPPESRSITVFAHRRGEGDRRRVGVGGVSVLEVQSRDTGRTCQ